MNFTDVPLALQPGIHNITADEYAADPCERPSLSASIAKLLISHSPLHAKTAHPRLNPSHERREAQHLDIGVAAHALLLEGRDAIKVIDADDWRTAAAREARDEARALGQVPLLAARWQEVVDMVDMARWQLEAHASDPPVFADGKPERTLIWEDDGVLCRARPDWLRNDYATIDDYKTTSRSANPEEWSRSLFSMGQDVQAAFYLRGLEALTGKRAEWRWIVQEVAPPYALSVIALSPAVLELADAKVEYAIGRWRECVETDSWPGYPSQVCYAELPAWEETRWLEREARETA